MDRRRVATALRRREASLLLTLFALKGLVLAYGVAAYQVLTDTRLTGPLHALRIWDRWDTRQYLDIAQHGYRSTGEGAFQIAFFPLFPALVAATSLIVPDPFVSAIVVATVASLGAGLLFDRLVRLDFPARVAWRATIFLFIFPTSYFLHIGYAESLFLLLVLGSFLAARYRWWVFAGVLGALACLARAPGLLLLPALVVEVASQWLVERRWRWEWLGLALVPVGFLGYVAINDVVAGDAFAFLTVQREHWFKALDWPWVGLARTWSSIDANSHPTLGVLVGTQELVFAAVGLAGTVVAALRLRPSYAVWMGGNWLLFVSTQFVLSVPRFTLTLFPLYIIFALLARDPRVRAIVTAWSLLFLALFVGEFVRDRWAF